MKRQRALFVTIEAVEESVQHPKLMAAVCGLLCDFAARGYRIIVVTNQLKFGDQRFDSKIELLAALRRQSGGRQAVPVADVLLLGNAFDPGPFWDVARRFNLALDNSTYVSNSGEYLAAARNAGVTRNEPSDNMFGLAA